MGFYSDSISLSLYFGSLWTPRRVSDRMRRRFVEPCLFACLLSKLTDTFYSFISERNFDGERKMSFLNYYVVFVFVSSFFLMFSDFFFLFLSLKNEMILTVRCLFNGL